MSQWGQGQPGYQYPMQTGFPGGNPQAQQNLQFQPQNPQFQQPNQQQFQQQGGLGIPNGGGMVPQPTGFPGQRPPVMMQPQQTGFPGGSAFIQQQATGFPGGNFQQARPAPPPVPPIPSQFQQNRPSFLNAPPPQQPNRLLSASPGFGGGGLMPQQTGFGGAPGGGGMLVPQMTGFIDPRLQMMSQTFMPVNTSSPYNATGLPQLQPQSQNLVQSVQQYNQAQRGATTQQMGWSLTRAEKKNYDNIFRQWVQGAPFMSGPTSIEVFGASGLPKDDLARIWTLADIEDRGKLNLAEFHVAMGLIYRRLNGMPVPDQLPPELKPPSSRDLDDSVDRVKYLLEQESRNHSPSTNDSPISYLKNRSFNGSSPSLDTNRDATIYKHSDTDSTNVYKPRSRHVDRDAVRSRNEDDSPSADLRDMKRSLANTAHMLDRNADADAQKSKEDEELDREMDDLKYRVKRVQEDLDYNSRGPKTASKEEERRRLEREMLSLMHERIPEVERKIKAREERKEREKRQWTRDRDRANEKFGRYDSRDDYSRRDDRERPYSRGDDRDRLYSDRDRPYSRGDDRERSYSRNDDRDRPYSRGAYDDRDRRDRDYDRPRSPPGRAAPEPPAAPPASSIRDPPPAPAPQVAPSPSVSNMTAEERKVFLQKQAQLRIQQRMAALGVTTASSSPTLDTSVEDRLQQEKKEAEEKAKAAEKQAEERERARRERVENEKALKDGRNTPAVPPTPTPTSTAAPPVPAPKAAPVAAPKAAPPPPKPRAPAPPPPRGKIAPRAPVPPSVPIAPATAPVPEVDPEEEAFRAREDTLRKAREEREKVRQERERKLRELEEQEAAAERAEEERYQQRMESLRAKSPKPPTPVAAPPPPPPPPPPSAPATPSAAPTTPSILSPAEKSTNPFSKMLKEGGASSPSAIPPTNGNTNNPWARPQTAPPPSRSPAPAPAKSGYQTAPASAVDDDWGDVEEKDDDDSSDDELTASRSVRANIAQALFGGIVPRPASAAAAGPASSPSPTIANSGAPPAPPPPPPPPAAAIPQAPSGGPPPPPPPAPPAPSAPSSAGEGGGRGALFAAIQGGKALRPTKTVDKSGPPLSGKVLGDTAPPAHINAAPRPVSPPRAPSPPAIHVSIPEAPSMVNDTASKSDNRQSVGWFADRAADVGGSPVIVDRLPSTLEEDEESQAAAVPEILVDKAAEPMSDLMADIDKSTAHRVRSLYAFEGDGPEDLTFGENLMLDANPSKSGGDWWYGKLVSTGKAGLFPKTYVEIVAPKKAKAVYTYDGNNPDELPFSEGDTLDIVDTSEEEWWKAEQGGVVFIVPAAYLELVEAASVPGGRGNIGDHTQHVDAVANANPMPPLSSRNAHVPNESTDLPVTNDIDVQATEDDSSDDDSDSSADYLSFDESEDEEAAGDKAARERERQLVLEAAGLIVQKDVGPAPLRPRARSVKRRPAPAAPSAVRPRAPRRLSTNKDLPPVPAEQQIEHETETPPTPESELTHEARLDDAFARYESFKSQQANMNRLSIVSTDSSIGGVSSPTTTIGSVPMTVAASTHSQSSQNGRTEAESGIYSNFLHFLSRSKTPDAEHRGRSASTLQISAPIMIQPPANAQPQNAAQLALGQRQDVIPRSSSPSFGMSWASLVDKTALEGIPPGERKRQEAIFELINTEIAYVRDLQLIVEVFYSTMLPLLSTKEITVVFANIEDLLLTNTGFTSSLEERQKECRLYIDKIGDILLSHIPNMGVYMEYCVNQATAIKVLHSLRDSNPDLALHLQRLRDENPTVRNLDLSSYLLAPMQRVTRYPLLIKQILQYTEAGEEHNAIEAAHDMSEKLLGHINETIRDQENFETLKQISQHLWIGQGRLDLTAPTRNMGPRRLLKEGVVMKAKSGRKLNAFLCSDILVLTDESGKNLYRIPIPLSHAQVKESGSRDETGFQISQPYPRGGDTIALRAISPRDCQQWIREITQAIKKARQADERASRKAARR